MYNTFKRIYVYSKKILTLKELLHAMKMPFFQRLTHENFKLQCIFLTFSRNMFLLVCTITDLYVVILSCTFTTQILTKNFLFHQSLAILVHFSHQILIRLNASKRKKVSLFFIFFSR